MKTTIREFFEGATKAKGLTVIIDVFRAFSVACYAFEGGLNRYLIAGSVEEAFSLKKQFPDAILVGERDEKMIEGFDLGNSPTQIITNDLKGKSIIHCTTAGTKGVALAKDASEIVTGSLINAGAVARYIQKANPEVVTLVAMGYHGTSRAEEDMLCASYIKSILDGNIINPSEYIDALRTTSGARFFVKENIDFSPPTDFYLCTLHDRFNFTLSAIKMPGGHIELIRVG